MKHKTHHMYYLFYPGSWIIIIALLLYSITVSAQETPAGEDKFYIGAEFHNQTIENTIFYDPFDTSGMNTISQRADIVSTWSHLKDYNILASNVQNKTDWIAHYTTCYYSKWEAEENQTDEARVGVKHKWGQQAFWNDTVSCWSTIGITDPKNSIMFGPHYRQDKRYKRWLYDTCYNQPGCLSYTPRFRMALDNHGGANSDEDVCIIKVVFSYRYENTYPQDTTFIQRTLKVRDFDSSGGFDDFYLDPNTPLGRYEYPPEFSLPMKFSVAEGVPSPVGYIDSESFTGIQFCVDWLRDDTLCTLYIDYVEVYDNNGWNEYVETPGLITTRIQDYAASFNNQTWQNIRYWLGVDEPYSIDCYTPIRVVDELVRSVNPNTPLVVPFNPTWSWDNYEINGEDEVSMFYNIAKPKRITLSNNPCLEDYTTIRYEDFEFLRFNLQRTSALDSNFWFNVQAEGYRTNYNEPNEDPEWCIWRKPQPAELRAMVMLASAHGAKGIFFKWFDSYVSGEGYCGTTLKDAIVSPTAEGTELYYEIKNNLAPRLTGKLGKTLMGLDYTGEYIDMEYQEQPPPQDNEHDYLSIQHYGMSYFWHAGFFSHKDYSDNKHFLLTNLRTNNAVESKLIVSNNTSYHNISFTDIEVGIGRVDTTINYNSSIEYFEEMPAGEGRLYRVAPVIKYGGRLLYDETISSTTTLLDEMTIEDDAVLTVNSNYNVDRTITIKDNGSIITTSGGTMKFYNNLSLIIEGSVTISGTAEHKLILDFLSPADSNGIIVKSGGSLTIAYCEIKNAGTGIFSELNADSLIVEYVDFIECEDNSISIAGRSGEENVPIKINNCSIDNSEYGIFVNNTSSILIRWNEITDTDCGIYLSNVSDALIVCNKIGSSNEELQGILSLSSGGIIYGNMISGHTSAIQLGNSSPKIGVNAITSNKYHGIYVGANSNPYMKGEYIGNPALPYGLSGYNTIYENGGYEGEGDDNDGSEIYFYNSKAVLIMVVI
ncbi:MAG: right-handed parallel beta-helix repeat-containing protein [Ignavibacteriaceae bacterium]|nr:right-handed parallel beta-helix repeat-containing protein [Ignavibacteriaceae bacterium]